MSHDSETEEEDVPLAALKRRHQEEWQEETSARQTRQATHRERRLKRVRQVVSEDVFDPSGSPEENKENQVDVRPPLHRAPTPPAVRTEPKAPTRLTKVEALNVPYPSTRVDPWSADARTSFHLSYRLYPGPHV